MPVPTLIRSLAAARPPRAIPAVALAAALLAPGVAHAAQPSHDPQGFVGVTDSGQVVRLSDRTLPAISTPVAVSGLRGGDAIVALDRAPSGELLALGRSSAIYTLDASTGHASQKLAPFTGSIDPSAPVTFSIAPDGASVLVIASGVDENVSLASGAATPAPAPAYAPGDPHAGQTPALAADALSDGRLAGVDAAHGDFVVQQSADGPFVTSTAVPGAFENPTRVSVAPDGSVWLAAKLGSNHGREYRQTRLVRFDPATGRVGDADGPYLSRELVAFAAVGPVPVPTAAPQAQITVPARESLGEIDAHHGIVARVRLSEGGQVVVSTHDRSGQTLGFGFDTRDDAGSLAITSLGNAKELRELRRLVGTRVQLEIRVHDFAGHVRTYDRSTQIVA
jgi:Domain of unknown function (DUF4394)